jgi:sugar lactone lactonase YvrE
VLQGDGFRVSAIEQITGPVCQHAEGAYWSSNWKGGLRWLDMLTGDVLRLLPDGEVSRHDVGERVACIRPRPDGGAVVALGKQFAVLSPRAVEQGTGRAEPLTPELWTTNDVFFNEGAIDPDGRFWCGTAADDSRVGAGTMYRLDLGGGVSRVFEGVTISNGLAWDLSGSTAYYVDSATNAIVRLVDLPDAGGIHREPWVAIPRDLGEPDGLCVDADGSVWVAIWGGSCVCKYSAAGELTCQVAVPAPNVTSCTLGDEDLRTLYITTSQLETDISAHPAAGALFSIRAESPGFRAPACMVGIAE